MEWLDLIPWHDWRALVEIGILSVLFYFTFLFFRGTRSAQVMTGLLLFIVGMVLLTKVLHLDVLNYLMRQFSLVFMVALLVIFQPEIRRALAELGKPQIFSQGSSQRSVVDALVESAQFLADRRIGALMAVERDIATRSIQETGTRMDARCTAELLSSIFFPQTPLHDGGVIICGNRISSAGCVFPLSQRTEISKGLGTRHRAAIGLTEETDAVVVIVSEETGTISVSYRGRLSRGLDEERLRRFLSTLLVRSSSKESRWQKARKQLDLTPEGIAKSENLAEKEDSSGD
jgi:diadenylate cyclase